MSKTPLTDSFFDSVTPQDYMLRGPQLFMQFARTLELQLQAVTRQRDVAVEEIENAQHDRHCEMALTAGHCDCWKRDALARIEVERSGK